MKLMAILHQRFNESLKYRNAVRYLALSSNDCLLQVQLLHSSNGVIKSDENSVEIIVIIRLLIICLKICLFNKFGQI